MILRSGKIVIKRPKHSSAVVVDKTNYPQEKEEMQDYISSLPDALLTHILSLLPDDATDAIRTCILSKRWNHLWVFLPNLRFVTRDDWSVENFNSFHDSVDKALALRDGMPIQRFFLCCNNSAAKCDYNRVYDSLCTVIQCKVRELQLSFPYYEFMVRLCWDLFKTCNTLVAFTLEGGFLLDVPEGDQVLFPCLKKLTLKTVLYRLGDKSFEKLISGCPVLEELYFERDCDMDNLKNFSISSSSLKRLEIYFTTDDLGWVESVDECGVVVIDTPKLEHIYITDDSRCTVLSIIRPPSCLIEAHLDVFLDCSATRALLCVSSAKILTLTFSTIHALNMYDGDYEMPMFPNMVKLVIGIYEFTQCDLLFNLFNNMPNLEEIAFHDASQFISSRSQYDWIPPAEAPPCLSYKVKKITLLSEKCKEMTSEALTLIKYMLKHAKNLEALTINAHNIISKTQQAGFELPSWLIFI